MTIATASAAIDAEDVGDTAANLDPGCVNQLGEAVAHPVAIMNQ